MRQSYTKRIPTAFDLFISYARTDNQQGQVRALNEQIVSDRLGLDS